MPSRPRLWIGGIAFGILVVAGAVWLGFAVPLGRLAQPEGGTAVDNAAPPPETLTPVFRPCAHCHEIGSGARHKTGPHLNGVFGRAAGDVAGYPFSHALRTSGLVWDETTLARFLRSPQEVVPGTRMPFSGVEADMDLSALLAFLREPNPDQPLSR